MRAWTTLRAQVTQKQVNDARDAAWEREAAMKRHPSYVAPTQRDADVESIRETAARVSAIRREYGDLLDGSGFILDQSIGALRAVANRLESEGL